MSVHHFPNSLRLILFAFLIAGMPFPTSNCLAADDPDAESRAGWRMMSELGTGFVVWESNRNGRWRIWRRGLDGSDKRVVIWEFAARELAFGDWRRFSIPQRRPENGAATSGAPSQSAGQALVQGTVRAAGAPQPGSVPYRDAVTGVHLDRIESLKGSFSNSEIVVYLWGLRDDRLQAAAKFVPNQKVKLRLVPWESVRGKYERFNRIELDDPDFHLAELPIYWAEEAP